MRTPIGIAVLGDAAPPVRRVRNERLMRPPEGVWGWHQANAHLPEVQAEIRAEIVKGTIRVIPAQGGGIRIVPGHPADRGADRPGTSGP